MHRLGSALVAVSLFAGCGGVEAEAPSAPSTTVATQQAPILTETDVDVAAECGGILTFVNASSYTTLDRFLPSNVATNLVNARPFSTLAQVAAVPLVGPARLKQIEGGARTLDYIDADCVGIIEDLAISRDDQTAIVQLVNSISDSELHDVLPDAWNGAANLLNTRPFTTAQQIADTAGIAQVSFRNIRNSATLSRPFEALVNAVNALPSNGSYGATMARHFDWWPLAIQSHRYNDQKTCFGLEPTSTPYGSYVRPNLANATEVYDAVVDAVNYVDWNGTRISPAVRSAGLANLQQRVQGRTFKGCIVAFADDPWSGHTRRIYVDTVNGFSVFTETWWAE